MKKLLIALVFSTFTYAGANAQIRTHCGMDKGYVCHVHGQTADCYKTNYAQNFPVCKGPNGYYICCGKDASKEMECTDDDLAMMPKEEKKTIVCERNGNMTACYETPRVTTTYYTRVNTD